MFQQMKNIDSAFRYIRTFSLIFLLSCSFLTGFVIYNCYQLMGSSQQRVYILANGKAFEAIAAERKDNIAIEAKDHVRTFHEYFFTLDPDNQVIETNISKALNLADVSAKRQYENLKENGYYTNIIAGNISQQITVDSIYVDLKQYPLYFRCYATEKIIRLTNIVFRSLVTEGFLRSVSRSENNSHGFLIERWETLANKDVKTETQLPDPAQALVVKRFEDARFNLIQRDVAVNIVKDDFFHLLLLSAQRCLHLHRRAVLSTMVRTQTWTEDIISNDVHPPLVFLLPSPRPMDAAARSR